MADYCSKCSPFEGEFEIDLLKIALRLKNGHSELVMCEGCNIRGVYKDEGGKLYLARAEKNEVNLYPVAIEDLMP